MSRGISSFYGSPIRLTPINKTAVSSFYSDKSSCAKVKKKRRDACAVSSSEKKAKKSEKIRRSQLPKDGLILPRKAGMFDFVPVGVIVKGISVKLSVPGWTEALGAIVSQLKKSLGDDLKWVENMYLERDENGYPSKSSCLWKLRHLSKILGLERDDVVLVAPRETKWTRA